MSYRDQHCVFISSTGRTGTQFLAKTMSEMIADCTSLHEPGTPWITKPYEWPKEVKRFGLYHMTIGQLRPTHGMFKLSTDRCTGRVTDDEAKDHLLTMRKNLLAELETDIYVESSGHMYGVLDLLDEIIPHSKFVFIIRDPRTWVRSAMNTFEYILYGPLDPNFLNLSIKAKDITGDPYAEQWAEMSKFEKYCWYYDQLNSFVLDKMEGKDNFKLIQHENMFSPESRDQVFTDLLSFASSFSDGFQRKVDYKPELMEQKVHSTAKKEKFPRWPDWNQEMAATLWEHCGSWMERFGYGGEPEWEAKLS